MVRRRKHPNNGLIIKGEKEILTKMVSIYCRKRHKQKQLCEECHDLERYAHTRLPYCRFGEEKSACSNCSVHCYKQVYREKIKTMMRYSGKWMLLYHPVYSVKHLLKK